MFHPPVWSTASFVLLSCAGLPAAATGAPPREQTPRTSQLALEHNALPLASVPIRDAPATRRDSLPSPSPRVLDMLRRFHRSSDWLFISTRSGRYRLRVSRIDSLGLTGFRARQGPPPIDALAWKDVVRIERRDSRFRAWQFTGAGLGAVGGLVLGRSMINSGAPDGAEIVGLAVGMVLGGTLGGVLGDRNFHTTPLYAAEMRSITAPEPAPRALAQTPPVEARFDVDLESIRALIRPRHLLRVRGDLGWAVGRVDSISSTGLHGLRPDTRHDPGLGPVRDPIPWSSIARIDRRGNSAGTGAVIGGVTLTLVGGALIGALAASSSKSGVGPAVAGGILVSGVAGATLGSLIGALIPKWHPVLKSRASPQPLTTRSVRAL